MAKRFLLTDKNLQIRMHPFYLRKVIQNSFQFRRIRPQIYNVNLIKLQFVIKISVLSIFEWPFYTGKNFI